jgi:hypothetical protein
MSHFALVATWTLPDDADQAAADAALQTIVNRIHAASAAPAESVAAYVGVSAKLIGQAARAGQLTSQADRLQLQPGDTVVITLPGEETDYDADDMRKTASVIFPDHHVVFIWDGSTVTVQPGDPA